MKRMTLSALLLTAALGGNVAMAQESEKPYVSDVWVADLGNGKYHNPILCADYSDPDVCRVGDDYYMTASSFNCLPGLPILHSKDLVNWTIIGHAVAHTLPPVETPERGHPPYGITTAPSTSSGETPTRVPTWSLPKTPEAHGQPPS